jgi:3-methyladenine DNA glycosylase Tag
MQPPKQITPTNLSDYLQILSKVVFQSGMSWKVIDTKWPGFVEAFDGFDPAIVAAYSPDTLDALTADTRIIRNRRKIEATVANAQTLLELDHEFGGFGKYLKSKGGDFDALVRDMRKRFKFVGTFGAYYFLYVVGEPVPSHEEFRARMSEI